MQFNESHVEEATLEWFEKLGYSTAHGDDVAPESPHAKRESFGDVLLVQRLREALLPKLLSASCGCWTRNGWLGGAYDEGASGSTI